MIALILALGGCKGGAGEAPPEDELVAFDLGSATVGADGFTGPIAVEVPEGAVSVLAWCGGYGDAGLGSVWYIDDPGGARVFDGDAPDPDTYRAEFLDDLAPALVPISPALDVSPGTWTFDWYVESSDTDVSCEAVARVDEVSANPTLFVDLVFVSVPGLDADTAPDDPNFQAMIAEVEGAWGSRGISATFNYVPFTGDVTRFGVVDVTDDDYSEFNDLLRTTNPESSRTLTFFLVEEISNAGETIVGLSAGPPGAASFSATSKSGVIVSTVDLATAPEDVGKIVAHEGGHFLGLFHPVEKDGSNVDPLADTPVCTDDGGDGVLNAADCGGEGAENVMWWSLDSGAPTQSLTDDQAWVIARNPIAD